jgi:hypothetical protein
MMAVDQKDLLRGHFDSEVAAASSIHPEPSASMEAHTTHDPRRFRRDWEKNHVASMSRGAAGKVWEALKTNGNFCDMTRHEIGENASQFAL